jgi:hypothetical protein
MGGEAHRKEEKKGEMNMGRDNDEANDQQQKE